MRRPSALCLAVALLAACTPGGSLHASTTAPTSTRPTTTADASDPPASAPQTAPQTAPPSATTPDTQGGQTSGVGDRDPIATGAPAVWSGTLEVDDIAMTPDGTGALLVSGSDDDHQGHWVFRTADGGVTWLPSEATYTDAGHVSFARGPLGWAWGPGLAETVDGGRSWTGVATDGAVRGVATTGASTWLVAEACVDGPCQHATLGELRGEAAVRRLASVPLADVAGLAHPSRDAAIVLETSCSGCPAGHGGRLAVTSDRGHTWSVVPTHCGPRGDAVAVTATSAREITVYCDIANVVNGRVTDAATLVTSDGGRTWRTHPGRATSRRGGVVRSARSGSSVWGLVEGAGYDAESVAVRPTATSGWHDVLSLADAEAPLGSSSLVATDDRHAWYAVAQSAATGQRIAVYRTADGGVTWASSTFGRPQAVPPEGMDTVPPTSATDWPRDVGVRWLQLLATGRGTVDVSASTHDGRDGRDWELATADGGRTWHVTGTGTADRPLRQTVWVTPSVGWRGPTHPQVTTDGGRSWRASALPHLDSLSRLSSDGTTLWAQANRCDALDCTTALATGSPTGGLRWITVPGLAHAWDVSAATGAAYVLGANTRDQHGPGVIAVTRNSGRTWQRRVGPCGSGDLVGPASITATSAYDVEVVCTLYSGAASFRAVDERLFASHDGGRTWTPETLTTPSRDGRFADVRVAGGTVWAAVSLRAGNGDGLFWSYDAGRTWEGFPPRALPMAADPTLAVLDARHVVWAYVRRHGDYFQVVVASTADGGRTWHRYLVPRLT